MHRPSTPSFVPLRAVFLLCISLIALSIGQVRTAAAATYEVSIPATIEWPGWWSPTEGGPFSVAQRRISTGTGSFALGAYGRWRLETPGMLRIAGGHIAGSLRTTTPGIVSRLRVGSDGGAVRTLWSSDDTTSFSRSLPNGNDWVEFGLYATSALRTLTPGENSISMTSMSLTMRDDAAPVTSLTRVPDPLVWHGPSTCAPWSLDASDSGSGIEQLEFKHSSASPLVHVVWNQDVRPGLAPGQPRVKRSECIPYRQATHGANSYQVTAADAAGNMRTEFVRARFDLHPPTIALKSDVPAEYDTPMPELRLTIADADSGLADVRARIDGQTARVEATPSGTTITSPAPLSVGEHHVEVTAGDVSGNTRTTQLMMTVVDRTAPIITITSPREPGSSTPWAAATATDAGSGIAAHTWSITVDGVPSGIASATSTIAGPLGTLAPGTHTINFQVFDSAGNRGVSSLSYTVSPMPGTPPSGVPGGRSGIFVQDNLQPIYRYGSRVRIRVLATRAGRPLAGYRLNIRQAGKMVGTSVTDVTGVGTVDVPATRPGTMIVMIPDPSIAAAKLRIRVAPRIRLRTAARRPLTGHPIRLTGKVFPAPHTARARARLYTRVDGTWYPLRRTIALRRNGSFSTTVTSVVRGVIAVQARVPHHGTWSPSASQVVLLHVHDGAASAQASR